MKLEGWRVRPCMLEKAETEGRCWEARYRFWRPRKTRELRGPEPLTMGGGPGPISLWVFLLYKCFPFSILRNQQCFKSTYVHVHICICVCVYMYLYVFIVIDGLCTVPFTVSHTAKSCNKHSCLAKFRRVGDSPLTSCPLCWLWDIEQEEGKAMQGTWTRGHR